MHRTLRQRQARQIVQGGAGANRCLQVNAGLTWYLERHVVEISTSSIPYFKSEKDSLFANSWIQVDAGGH